MGLFTGLALGGMAAFSAYSAMKAKKAKAAAAQLAPSPVDALTPPSPPIVQPGVNEGLAQAAATKQKKRAARGSLLTSPIAPASNIAGVAAKTIKKSLIGGY